MWEDWVRAFCLMLILEGLMPVLSPGRWRNMVKVLAHVDDRALRNIGIACMVTGALLLFLVR